MSEENIKNKSNDNSNKKKLIIAGSILGVATVVTAIVVPVVLLTGDENKSNSSDIVSLETNLEVISENGISSSEDILVEKGSIVTGQAISPTPGVDPVDVFIPEADTTISEWLIEILDNNYITASNVTFDSFYISTSVLESFSFNDKDISMIAVSAGVTNLQWESDDYEFNTVDSAVYSNYFSFVPALNIDFNGGKINGNNYTYDEHSELTSNNLGPITSFDFVMTKFEGVTYGTSTEPISSQIDWRETALSYAGSKKLLEFDQTNQSDYTDSIKLDTIEYNFTSGTDSKVIEVGHNKLNVR